jgi:hypothetical protein
VSKYDCRANTALCLVFDAWIVLLKAWPALLGTLQDVILAPLLSPGRAANTDDYSLGPCSCSGFKKRVTASDTRLRAGYSGSPRVYQKACWYSGCFPARALREASRRHLRPLSLLTQPSRVIGRIMYQLKHLGLGYESCPGHSTAAAVYQLSTRHIETTLHPVSTNDRALPAWPRGSPSRAERRALHHAAAARRHRAAPAPSTSAVTYSLELQTTHPVWQNSRTNPSAWQLVEMQSHHLSPRRSQRRH